MAGKKRVSKRQLIRDERRAKRSKFAKDNAIVNERKRQRVEEDNAAGEEYISLGVDEDADNIEAARARKRQRKEALTDLHDEDEGLVYGGLRPEREYFGMLADEEQEYFRRADELLEINDFPAGEREIFLENVYKEAKGKELKLASSQSCSRLMERLILLSSTRQKKRLFEAFAGHFMTLVTHRFASHCCEKLFLQSATVVSGEALGIDPEEEEKEEEDALPGEEKRAPLPMEQLFLLTLDELDGHLTYLMSDRFGSHALRVLLVVLSGKPLDQVSTKSLLQSRRKEHVSVDGVATAAKDEAKRRTVPDSFAPAIQKITEDTTATLDETTLKVLATHPLANPVLQLLLEIDHTANGKDKDRQNDLLIYKLLPDAPQSLNDEQSAASKFVGQMLYDPIGSRLLETIIEHSPAKIFKALHANVFGPRITSYVRNDIASYPAIKALTRMSKEDLAEAINKILEQVPMLVQRQRYSVLKALFERCRVRHADAEIAALLRALHDACADGLVQTLCFEKDTREIDEPKFQLSKIEERQKAATISHGCQLLTTLLGTPGRPAEVAQESLLTLDESQVVHLATKSMPTAIVLTTALETSAKVPNFHKALATKIMPSVMQMAASLPGHNVVNAIASIPSKGPDRTVPFHVKERIVGDLAETEAQLRQSWTGRSVWRTWKGDLWLSRRSDWTKYMRSVDVEEALSTTSTPVKLKPWQKVASSRFKAKPKATQASPMVEV